MWSLKVQEEFQVKLNKLRNDMEKEGLIVYEDRATFSDQFRYFATVCFYLTDKKVNPDARMIEINKSLFISYMEQTQNTLGVNDLLSTIFNSGIPYKDSELFCIQDLPVFRQVSISEDEFLSGVKLVRTTADAIDIVFNVLDLITGSINIVKQRLNLIDRKMVNDIE